MNLSSSSVKGIIQNAPVGKISHIEVDVPGFPGQGVARAPLILAKGLNKGPTLWLSSTIHGDELNGIEVIHRLTKWLNPDKLHGMILAFPIVNVHGFLNQSRYLPDRRDLNRSFPGSSTGSLASRMAQFLKNELLSECNYGIDFHTASEGNRNIIQVRTDLNDSTNMDMAVHFGAPATLHASLRDGSLRHAAFKLGIKMLVVEMGSTQRFDETEIQMALEGCQRVLKFLGMYKASRPKKAKPTLLLWNSSWQRAPASGIFKANVKLGEIVKPGQYLGQVFDSFGELVGTIRSKMPSIVLGCRTNPLVYQGDALFNLGIIKD